MIGTLIAKKSLADAFNALNQHDLAKFMSAWSSDGEFVYPGVIPASGSHQGKSAVEAWFQHFFEQYPEIKFEVLNICVRNIFDLVGNNVVAVHWNLTLKNREGFTTQNSGVTVVSIHGGKAFRAQDFIFDLGDNFKRAWSAA